MDNLTEVQHTRQLEIELTYVYNGGWTAEGSGKQQIQTGNQQEPSLKEDTYKVGFTMPKNPP